MCVFGDGGRGVVGGEIGNSKQGTHYTDRLKFMERFLLFQKSEKSSKSGHTDDMIENIECVRACGV